VFLYVGTADLYTNHDGQDTTIQEVDMKCGARCWRAILYVKLRFEVNKDILYSICGVP
jgi:hypothetical protein